MQQACQCQTAFATDLWSLASPLTAGLGWEPGNKNPISPGPVTGDSEMKQQDGTDQCLGILFYVV